MIRIGSDIWGFLEIRDSDGLWVCKGKIPDDRDYEWFALLAGVRNYINIDPMANPRGTPVNASVKVTKNIDNWGSGRTYSWLTYEDFLDYNWNNVFYDEHITVIDRETGKEVRYTERTQLNCPDLYEYIHLSHIAKDLITTKWAHFLNRMELLSLKYGPENVRIVFWFD